MAPNPYESMGAMTMFEDDRRLLSLEGRIASTTVRNVSVGSRDQVFKDAAVFVGGGCGVGGGSGRGYGAWDRAVAGVSDCEWGK